MSSTIKIKRSSNTASPPQLSNGELAWTEAGNVVFIGSYDGTINIPIAGWRTPGTLTANQAIVTNGNNMIDAIRVGTSAANVVLLSTGITIANSTNTVTIVPPTTVQKGGTYFLKADGSWAVVTGAVATPGGSNTDIQFNDSGATAGTDNLQWNKDSNTLTLTGNLVVSGVMTVNTSLLTVSNATSNVNINPATLAVQNSTSNVSISTGGVTIANTSNTITIVPPSTVAKAGSYYLKADGSWSTVSPSPAGSNTQIQFNDSGSLGSDAFFTWNKATEALVIGNSSINVTANSSQITWNGTGVVANSLGFYTSGGIVNSSIIGFASGSQVNSTGAILGILYGNQINSAANVSLTGANVYMASSKLTVGDVVISGNLTVQGTTTSVDTTTLQVKDSLIKLADAQATADIVDIGIYGEYGNSTVTKYAGIFRSAANGNFFIFKDVQSEPSSTVNASATGYATGVLYADLVSSNVNFTGGTISSGVNQTLDCGTF